jgi:serine protease Do
MEFNGTKIGLSSELPHLVGRLQPGTKAKMEIVRQGDEKDVSVIVGQLPGDDEVVATNTTNIVTRGKLNIEVRNLNSAEKTQLQVSGGVLVTQVMDGPGAEAGIQVNDVISSIDSKSVNSVTEFNDLVEALPKGKSVPVLIIRGGGPAFIVLKVGE